MTGVGSVVRGGGRRLGDRHPASTVPAAEGPARHAAEPRDGCDQRRKMDEVGGGARRRYSVRRPLIAVVFRHASTTPTRTDSERVRANSRGERDDNQLESAAGDAIVCKRIRCLSAPSTWLANRWTWVDSFLASLHIRWCGVPVPTCSRWSAADCGSLFQVVADCCGRWRPFPASSPSQILCNVTVSQARISQG